MRHHWLEPGDETIRGRSWTSQPFEEHAPCSHSFVLPAAAWKQASERLWECRRLISSARWHNMPPTRRRLELCGCRVLALPPCSELPDATFVEDAAVVLDEVAILCSPGARSRQGEVAAIEPTLRELRPLARIELPATLDGGDVLRVGRELWVGQSSRTNPAGIAALR